MTTIVLWRHSRTGFNTEGRLQGSLDIPLGDEGRAQARIAGQRIVDAWGTGLHIVSSPLARARDSAAELANLAGVPVQVDEALTQRSYGVWEGLTHQEVASRWPEEYAAKQRGEDPQIDGWGTSADVAARVGQCLRQLAKVEGVVVVVSHGSAIQLGLSHVLHVSPTQSPLGHVPHAAWSVVTPRLDGPWKLDAYGCGAP